MNEAFSDRLEPFLDHPTNPTMQILDAIQSDRVHTLVLPVEYERAADILIKTIKNASFDAALMLGLAADRTFVSLEYQALNLMDALAPDNAGVRKRFEKITDGPESILSSLPVKTLIIKSDAEKRPLKLSLSAGSYVCNDLFYRIRYTFKDLMAGFIHVPKEETLALHEQIKTIEWIIQHLEA